MTGYLNDYFTPSLLESLDIVMIGVRLNAHSCARLRVSLTGDSCRVHIRWASVRRGR